MATTRISEKKKIRRRKPCGNQNELFLAWYNSRGGIEGFLFEANHGVTRSTGDAYMIEKYTESIENGQSFISMIKKDSFRELQMVAPQVDKQTRDGLESILSSPKVYMLLNGLNEAWDSNPLIPPKWQEVIVRDGRSDMGDTDEDTWDFNLQIELQRTVTLWD